jgi:hypothetical protein
MKIGGKIAILKVGLFSTMASSLFLLPMIGPMVAKSASLPDNRIYEMVTPGSNYNADVYVPDALGPAFVNNAGESVTELPFQVSLSGEAVAYVADPTVEGTGDTGDGEGNEYISRRLPNGSWGAPQDIEPGGIDSAFYEGFSGSLSLGIMQAGSYLESTIAPLSEQAPAEGYAVLYAHNTATTLFSPLFTTRPPDRSPSEFQTSKIPTIYPVAPNELAYAGMSAYSNEYLFEANDALTPNAPASIETANNLYASKNGRLSMVNVLPDGTAAPGATFGGPPKGIPGENPPDFEGAISSDGSKIFWTYQNSGHSSLYVSENVGSPTEKAVEVDASQMSGGGGGGQFWAANKEGSKVFFTAPDTAKLTTTTISGSGVNLYEYQVAPRRLVDLTATSNAQVEGVLGEGENKHQEYTLYFVAKGVLSKESNRYGGTAVEGSDNLYMLSQSMVEEGHEPKFIMGLSHEDGAYTFPPLGRADIAEYGDWQPGLGHRTAEVEDGGEALVFMSNNAAGTGEFVEVENRRLEEVYVYEASTGELVCASCGRVGVKPQATLESKVGLGAFLPVSWSNTVLPQWMSADGSRVFFDSDEPLVPEDTNGEQDVYEWERQGAGDCEVKGGCVYLLSGGAGPTSSWLIGGSESGNDVFFVSREDLVADDKDETYNLFDARVNGVQPVLPPTCTGTGCQGLPASPPVFSTPPSTTFAGVGNFSPAAETTVKKTTKKKKKSKAKAKARKRSGSGGKSGVKGRKTRVARGVAGVRR